MYREPMKLVLSLSSSPRVLWALLGLLFTISPDSLPILSCFCEMPEDTLPTSPLCCGTVKLDLCGSTGSLLAPPPPPPGILLPLGALSFFGGPPHWSVFAFSPRPPPPFPG
eukprot:RCo005792